MKKLLLVFVLIFVMATGGFAQETIIYSFFVNVVSEQFRFPLIGFVNIARGDHRLPQLGLVNWNTGNFNSFQAALINTVGGDFSGVQLGLVNTVAGEANGFQSALVNTTVGSFNGVQLALVNTTVGNFNGVQLGLANTTVGDFHGFQGGLVNVAANGGNAFQLGLMNTSFRALSGVQLGLFNYVDSIENGIPIGLISIVRSGGYYAIEYSVSEFHLVNVGFKFGVERFYTTLLAAYDPLDDFGLDSFAFGLGFGSIIPINESFFFNPELTVLTIHSWDSDNYQQLLSFAPNFGYRITQRVSVLVAPQITWVHNFGNNETKSPYFRMVERELNENNSIVIGARAAIRFRF